MKLKDISIIVPAEFANEVMSIISKGISESNLPEDTKTDLTCWWEVESEFANEQLRTSH